MSSPSWISRFSVLALAATLLVGTAHASEYASEHIDEGCDAVYQRNLQELHHANQDNLKLFKLDVLVDTPERAAKYAGVKLLQRLGYFTVASEQIGRFIIIEGVGSIVTSVEMVGIATAANEVELGEYGDAYRLIVQAEEGGGPALEKFQNSLSHENPKWRISEETFRKIILRMNHDKMFCNDIVGDTIKEFTAHLQGLSDRDVDYWVGAV